MILLLRGGNMKLSLIMICDEDKEKVNKKLIEAGYSPTLIASTGEFLQFGKSILLLGIEEDKIQEVKEIVNEYTSSSQIKGGEILKGEIYILDAHMNRVRG